MLWRVVGYGIHIESRRMEDEEEVVVVIVE